MGAMYKCFQFVVLATLAAWINITPALAISFAKADGEYNSCVRAVGINPTRALEQADFWYRRDGNVAAKHCQALALVELEQYSSAARILDQIGGAAQTGDEKLRAGILGQAGNSWMLADKAERAISSFSIGLSLAANSPVVSSNLLLDRARAYIHTNKCPSAEQDLNKALDLLPELTDALVLRAQCYALENPRLASQDLNTALAIDPNHIEALTQRGQLHRDVLDFARAREDWNKVISLVPDSIEASYVRNQLAKIDLYDD